MKRIMSLVVVSMILLSAVSAWAATGDATFGQNADGSYDVYYSGVFSIGDTLYLISSDSLSTWHTGDAEPTRYNLQFPVAEGEENVSWSCWPFASNDSVYALALATRYGEHTEFQRAVLCRVELTAGDGENVAKLSELSPVNWHDLVDEYDQDTTAREPQSCVGAGNLACMLVYDDSSNLRLWTLNTDNGELKLAEGVTDPCSVTPYKNGTLLVEQFNYNDAENVRFTVYDPKAETCQQIARIKVENSTALIGVAYDAAKDALYCIKGGEIHSVDLQKSEVGPAIADAPVEYYNDSGACILDGGYFCYGASGAFVRNLDPAQRTETRIRVFDSMYDDPVQKAGAALPNAHGEISVAIDRDYATGERLVESMMNQDDTVDVYVVSSSDASFNAVYNRGFMAELDGSEKLTAFADRLYPAVKAALSRDGHLVALPIGCSASTFAVNEKALERLGLKLEDVPRNWSDMLDFIIELSGRVKPEDKINLFYSGDTCESAKASLFGQMFQDYMNYADHAEPVVGYDTELTRALMAKLDSIDFTKFGCKPEAEASDGEAEPEGDSDEGDGSLSLFECYAGCSFGSFYSEYTPILMSMNADTPTFMPLYMSVAFINPYTKHPKEAMLYMEQLVDSLSQETLYCVDPSLNSPVRNSYYEETMQEYKEALEALKAGLKDAEAEGKQDLESQIREMEQTIEEYEKTSWDISQAHIDWYRANDDNIVLQGVNWLYNGENGGEASNLIEQYLAGQIDAVAMLSGIDKKVTMMRMEGN